MLRISLNEIILNTIKFLENDLLDPNISKLDCAKKVQDYIENRIGGMPFEMYCDSRSPHYIEIGRGVCFDYATSIHNIKKPDINITIFINLSPNKFWSNLKNNENGIRCYYGNNKTETDYCISDFNNVTTMHSCEVYILFPYSNYNNSKKKAKIKKKEVK